MIDGYDAGYIQAHAYCARLVRDKAHSFHFAARFLPAERRREVFALYAFCRTVDDLADDPAGATPSAGTLLDGWRRWLQRGAAPVRDDPIKHAMGLVVQAQGLPLGPLIELVDGVDGDRTPRHLPHFAALERYCYEVAGTVGLSMAALLGARGPAAAAHARDLGIAMQLTNVLRDVGEDLCRGRIYLPADEMARFGYGRAELERGVIDDRFVALMRFQIGRARWYYGRGMTGLRYLPRDSQFPIMVAARTYGSILTKVERAGYDVFRRRAHTRHHEKLALAARLYAHRCYGALAAHT